MKKLIIDFDVLNTKDKFYDYISAEMNFPEWFGRNADALHDLLEGTDVHIRVKNAASAGAWAKPAISALRSLECAEFSEAPAALSAGNMKRSDFYYD